MRPATLAGSLSMMVLAAAAQADGPAADRPTVTRLKPSLQVVLPTVQPAPVPRQQDPAQAFSRALAELVASTQSSTRLGRLQEQVASGARDGCPNTRCTGEAW